jgi:hypothetical protein
MSVKIGKYNGNRNSGNIYTRVILTEIYHLSGMKSFRDDLIDRMKTGWGRFVLASHNIVLLVYLFLVTCNNTVIYQIIHHIHGGPLQVSSYCSFRSIYVARDLHERCWAEILTWACHSAG